MTDETKAPTDHKPASKEPKSGFGKWLEKHQTWIYVALGVVTVVIAYLSLRAQNATTPASTTALPGAAPSAATPAPVTSGGMPAVNGGTSGTGARSWWAQQKAALQTAQAAQAGQNATLATEIAQLDSAVQALTTEAATAAASAHTTPSQLTTAAAATTPAPVAAVVKAVKASVSAIPATTAPTPAPAPVPAPAPAPIRFATSAQPGTALAAAQRVVTQVVQAARAAVATNTATPAQTVEAQQGTATLTPWQAAFLNSHGNTTIPAAPGGGTGKPTVYRNGVAQGVGSKPGS